MADIFGSLVEGYDRGRQRKRESQQQDLENALKYAQLQEVGYTPKQVQTPGLFGTRLFGRTQTQLVKDPNAVGIKTLERQKLQNENELNQFKLNRLRGAGQSDSNAPSKGMRVKEYDEYGLPKTYEPEDKLTPGQELAKDKATKEIFDAVEQNKMKRQQIKDAENSLPNVPQGLSGKLKIEWMKRFDPNNPLMTDWQKIKAIGTDAQLLNTARTKGAISDKEMALFAQAAANDDLTSAARLKPILARLENAINADESARFGAYQQSYKEDPRKWFGQGSQKPSGEQNFNTPEEADASGLPPGTVVLVQNRRYQI